MKKVFLLVMVGLLLCVGTVFSQCVPFTGTVSVEDDRAEGGNSEITMTETTRDGMPAWRIRGRMVPGLEYPYVTLNFEPDDATRERLRNARTIHFKVLGDGNRYRMEYRTEPVRDYAYHAFNFRTTAGEVTQVSPRQAMFIQPSWGASVPLNPRRAMALCIIPDDALRDGTPFDLTVFDLRIE